METIFYAIRSNGKLFRIPTDKIVCISVVDYLSTFYLDKNKGGGDILLQGFEPNL